MLVDGSRIEILFRVKTFFTTAAVTNRSHATRNFADPVFEPHKRPEFIPCFLLYVLAERFTVQQSVPALQSHSCDYVRFRSLVQFLCHSL